MSTICRRIQNNAPNNPYSLKVSTTGNAVVDGKFFVDSELEETWNQQELLHPITIQVQPGGMYSLKIRAVFVDPTTPQDKVVVTLLGGIEKTCVLTREGANQSHMMIKIKED